MSPHYRPAQQNVRRWERTENMKFFDDKITAEQRLSVDALRLPDVTYTQGVTLYLGGSREVLLRAFPGHTGGDTVVYDPESNVVFCGDLFWNRTLPNLIDASTREWIETLDTLVKDYPRRPSFRAMGTTLAGPAMCRRSGITYCFCAPA